MLEAGAPPDVSVCGRDELLKGRQLVEIEHEQVTGAEDGHQHTETAEGQQVKGVAQRPAGTEAQEDQEVHQ